MTHTSLGAIIASDQNQVRYCHPIAFRGEGHLTEFNEAFSKGPSAGPFNSFPSGVKREP